MRVYWFFENKRGFKEIKEGENDRQKNAPFKGASIGRLRKLRERHFEGAREDCEGSDAIRGHRCLFHVKGSAMAATKSPQSGRQRSQKWIVGSYGMWSAFLRVLRRRGDRTALIRWTSWLARLTAGPCWVA
jgi:hypothetical protein